MTEQTGKFLLAEMATNGTQWNLSVGGPALLILALLRSK